MKELRKTSSVIPIERVERSFLFLRGQKVILDADPARLYGVTTKRLNEQVRRNQGRFPEDFIFRLTEEEKAEVVANCDHLSGIKYSPALPLAFTEHGAIMVASVLSTSRAVEASVYVVRAFVRLRQMMATQRELASRLKELEGRLEDHDERFAEVFEAIRQLMTPPDGPRKKIGFESLPRTRSGVKEPRARYGRLQRGTEKQG
jgi:hypothetical protein